MFYRVSLFESEQLTSTKTTSRDNGLIFLSLCKESVLEQVEKETYRVTYRM